MDKEMMKALEADGEKLEQLTFGEDHGPHWMWGDSTIYAGERDVPQAEPIPPTNADLNALSKKAGAFIREFDPYGDRFSQRELFIIEAMVEGDPEMDDDGNFVPPPSQIEMVARAICEAEGMNPDDALGGWKHWQDAAKAAIRVLREIR